MADLISRLRQLVGDPVAPPAPPTWSDDELQGALDRHRSRWFDLDLTPEPDLTGDYKNWSANGLGNWEGGPAMGVGYTIRDGAQAVKTPSSHDLALGWWTFATSVGPPLFLTGYSYDLFGAAAEVLSWEAVKTGKQAIKSFDADGFRVQYESGTAGLSELFASRAGGAQGWGTVPLYRRDGPGSSRERSF